MNHLPDDKRIDTEFPGQKLTKHQKKAYESQKQKKRRHILKRGRLDIHHGTDFFL
jgi:hypothetical protein